MKIVITSALLFLSGFCFAQFPGPAGNPNTTALYKDSSAFVAWATDCNVQRGWQDIANKSLGFADAGTSAGAIGKAGENPVVSLGDSGIAILTFASPITNGQGFDFAVFENAFNDQFLELAFVEVSSDGINYFRFPPTSNTQTLSQIGPWDQSGDASLINNLAGKYRANYGTPFDLDELKNESGLDVNAVTHIKIIDVVGSVNPVHSTFDINQNAINDPYPTAFGNGGFDLDAIGVIHMVGVGIQENQLKRYLRIYPNPSNGQNIWITTNEEIDTVTLCNLGGDIINDAIMQYLPGQYMLTNLSKGIYFLKITGADFTKTEKIIVY